MGQKNYQKIGELDQDVEPKKCNVYCSNQQGEILCYDILELFGNKELKISAHSNRRNNYNPYRKYKEDFSTNQHKIRPETVYDLYQKKVQKQGGSGDKQRVIIDLSKKLVLEIQAHREILTSLQLINEEYIMSSSIDGYVRIWSQDGQMIGSVNINHPLPIKWNLQLNSYEKQKKNILFSLKVIELIFRRHKKAILMSEEKLINLNNFLNQIVNRKYDYEQEQTFLTNTLERSRIKQKVILMKDEYKPKDLKYDRIKNFYKRELQGASLKEMEANKRVFMIHKQSKQSENQQKKEEDDDDIVKDEHLLREKDPLAFFDPNFVKRLKRNYEKNMNPQTQKFSSNLDRHLMQGYKTSTNRRVNDKVSFDKDLIDESKMSNKLINKENKEQYNSSSSISKIKSRHQHKDFYDYARQKQLSHKGSRSQDVLRLHENSVLESGYKMRENSIIEERSQFQMILKNLNQKLKDSYRRGKSVSFLSNESTTILNNVSIVDRSKQYTKFPRIKGRTNKSIVNQQVGFRIDQSQILDDDKDELSRILGDSDVLWQELEQLKDKKNRKQFRIKQEINLPGFLGRKDMSQVEDKR